MNTTSNLVNCSASSIPDIEPDPDIAGIGILVAFASSGWLTLLACIAYYCLNPKVSVVDHTGPDDLVHPIDKLFLEKLNRFWIWTGRKSWDKWAQALEKTVLAFSDQQSITGIAILLSGYSQLLPQQNAKPITIYNWQILVDLAWFSSITHLTTLTCLRHYFRQRRALSTFRITCMIVNGLLLIVSTASTAWSFVNPIIPALCLFHPGWLTGGKKPTFATTPVYNNLYMAFIGIFLAFSYLTRIVQFYPRNSAIRQCFDTLVTFPIIVSNIILRSTRKRLIHSSKRPRFDQVIRYRLVLTTHCLLKAAYDMFSSVLWEITWLLIALIWGSIRVIIDRDAKTVYQSSIFEADVLPTDNGWGFGQVTAIILLLVPFISFFEAVYDTVFPHETPPPSVDSSVNTIEVEYSSLNVQDNDIPPEWDLHKYHWFSMSILLIYGFSLAVAGDLLYRFPYNRQTITASNDPDMGFYASESKSLVLLYTLWFLLDVVLLGIFTFFVISIPDEDPRLRVQSIGYQILFLLKTAMRRRPSDNTALKSRKTWMMTLVWYISVASIITGSALFDMWVLEFEPLEVYV